MKYVSLTQVCDFQGGSQPPKDQWIDHEKDGYVRMLQIRDFTQPDKDNVEYVRVSKTIKTCDEDDILIGRYGASVGKILTGLAGAYNVAIIKTIPDTSKLSKRFLYHYLNSRYFQNFILSVGSRAAQAGFNKDDLCDALIPDLALKEQLDIVLQLDKISELIALRKEQLAKLDQLVKARFVEMFGTENDFSRWPCCVVEDVADVCVGVVIKPTQYYADKGIPAFRSLNIGEMRVKNCDWVYFTEEGHLKNQKSIIRENDVLVIRSGAPGTACVATAEYAGYNAVDIIIAHPDNQKVNSVFLAAFTNMPHGMNQIRAKTGGAAQQHFNVGGYKAMHLMLPPLRLQNQFATFVEQTNKTKLTIQASLDKLEVMKKALMQEYFG